jgi:hypothetical protein
MAALTSRPRSGLEQRMCVPLRARGLTPLAGMWSADCRQLGKERIGACEASAETTPCLDVSRSQTAKLDVRLVDSLRRRRMFSQLGVTACRVSAVWAT